MNGGERELERRDGHSPWCRWAAAWVAIGSTACGTGISMDPIAWFGDHGVPFDRGDAHLADTLDARGEAEDERGLEGARDAGDERDTSVPLDDADGAALDATDAEPVNDGDVDRDISVAPDVGVDADAVSDSADRLDGTADQSDDGAFDVDAVDAGDGCVVAACGWPDADYYVDAQAANDGDGSRFKPFKTISAAVAAYQQVVGQPKKAYVAPGTYDQALGETFPLVLRGLSLQGAGRDQTLVVGTGTLVHAGDGGPFADQYAVTILAGDRVLETVISGITIRSESPVPAPNYYGVFCDRGSATGEVSPPAGQTQLEQVAIGPGFQASVLATVSTIPSKTGCNVIVRSSVLTGGWAGLRAFGCLPGTQSVSIVVQLGGPDPSDGNVISWMQAPSDVAAGARLEGCVLSGSFEHNTFVDSTYGIYIDDRIGWVFVWRKFTITHNVFERLTAGGVFIDGSEYRLDQLSDNRFINITRAVTHDPGTRAVAVSAGLLQLGKFRRNEFIGNDFGVRLDFRGPYGMPAPPVDLGTPADPGNNVFRCNSALNDTGADLAIVGDPTWPGGTINLAGNAWDHNPPTVLSTDATPNGCDISLATLPNATLDLSGSSLATPACPADRVPGQ